MKKVKLFLTYSIAVFCVMVTILNRPVDHSVLKTLTTHDDETVMIYMMNQDKKLVPITLYYKLSEDAQEQVVQLIQLMKQEWTIFDFTALIPVSLKCLSVNIQDNLVRVNFNEAFYAMNGTTEMRVIEGIVSSILQLNASYRVSFDVNGEKVTEMPLSHVPMDTFDSTLGVNNFELVSEGLHDSQSFQVVHLIENENQRYYMITTIRIPSRMNDLDFVNQVISDISKQYEVVSLTYDKKIATINLNRSLLVEDNNVTKDIQPLLFTMKMNDMADQFVLKVDGEIVNFHGTNEKMITYKELNLNTFEE